MEQKIQTSVGGQDANYLEYFTTPGGKKLKITIRSDAYDFQSHARCHVLTPALTWEVLCHIQFKLMKTPHKLAYGTTEGSLVNFFMKDRQDLIDTALMLLGEK